MSQIKIFSSFECFFNFKFAMTYEIILDHWITGHYQFNTQKLKIWHDTISFCLWDDFV